MAKWGAGQSSLDLDTRGGGATPGRGGEQPSTHVRMRQLPDTIILQHDLQIFHLSNSRIDYDTFNVQKRLVQYCQGNTTIEQ